MSRSVLAALLACVCAHACGAPDDGRWAETTAAIIGGEPDDHDGVVVVFQGTSACSGTVIGPKVVLTAAHCIDPSAAELPTVYFGEVVFSSGRLTADARARSVLETILHPGWDPDGGLTHDIALVRLATRSPGFPAYLGVLRGERSIHEDEIGLPAVLVGYGAVSPDGADAGRRMRVEAGIRWICTSPGGCIRRIEGLLVDIPESSVCFDYEDGGSCFGDSGGPALVTRDGEELVAGVASWGGEDCTLVSCYTKVDAYAAFIDDAFAPEGAGCQADEDCLSDHCEEGACVPPRRDSGGCGTAGPHPGALALPFVLVLSRRRRLSGRPGSCSTSGRGR